MNERDPAMKLAVFLDVDKTITKDYIQHVYAKALGVEAEYLELEKAFQSGAKSSRDFGAELISLFASRGFSKVKAEQYFSNVVLRPWVEKLFKLQSRGVAIYFVSSGPNYYIENLGIRHAIPKEQILCSDYRFDDKGIISQCDAVETLQKAQFVSQEVVKYDITLGIGDNAELDGPFVSSCTIAMLTVPADNFIHVANFNSVLVLIENLLKEKTAEESSISLDDLKKATIRTAFKRLSVGLWLVIAAVVISAFGAGVTLQKTFPVTAISSSTK
jgi:HAD superfamily phosphoserine phosphatase-like hydrolase